MILKDKTVFITGASRGIGKTIGLRFAKEGANIVVAAKTVDPHPKLPGTIYSAAKEIEAAGGKALAVQVDVRDEQSIRSAVEATIDSFGGIDIVINNASAINLTPSEHLPMKRFDLMNQINYRGTYLVSVACLPHLKKASNPHILTLSPPLTLTPEYFGPHVAYTISKFNMSLCMLGMAVEYRPMGIACNCLWPQTTIATAAVKNLLGGETMMKMSRTPDIVADAALQIVSQKSTEFSGNFCIDEDILKESGMTDFAKYSIDPYSPLMPDLFTNEYLEWLQKSQ